MEAIEINRLLESQVRGTNHGWLLKPILHWHAMVIVLCVFCENPEGRDEAWKAIAQSFDAWSADPQYSKSRLWKPLCRLYERAQRVRLTWRPKLSDTSQAPAAKAEQDPTPFSLSLPISLNSPDPLLQLPTNFEGMGYDQLGPTQSFSATQSFGMPMEDMMITQDPLMTEIPWDWSTWDATYNETT